MISRPLSLALDAVRAVTALVVVLGHSRPVGFYVGPVAFPWVMHHAAVIVFFVLSGFVIANTAQARETDLAKFAVARFSRILPVAWPALLLGTAVWAFNRALGGPDIPQEPGYQTGSLASLLYPLMFLSELPQASGPVWNSPYWSLCYEVWYYALFAAAVFLRGSRRLLWLAALALLAGLNVVMLMPVWLAGVWLARRLPQMILSPLQAALLVALGCWFFWLFAGLAEPLLNMTMHRVPIAALNASYSRVWLADWLMAPALVAVFAGLGPLAQRAAPLLERCAPAIKLLAGSSFTLYLMHWPVMCLLITLGIKAHSMWTLAPLIAALQALAIAGASLFERRWTPRLRQVLTAAMERRGLEVAKA
ncbi:MAG: acyltransferase family protein [Novosphingobium sp.]